jgi:enterochelin esterase-like enzyme
LDVAHSLPNYDTQTNVRYLVLYLQHGCGEDERGRTNQGHRNFILDNLIASKNCKPIIVVMANGDAQRPGQFAPESNYGQLSVAEMTRVIQEIAQVFDVAVTQVLTPFIDSYFKTIPDRDNRTMAGLPMGGGQAFSTLMHTMDKFAYLGDFSRVPGSNGDPAITSRSTLTVCWLMRIPSTGAGSSCGLGLERLRLSLCAKICGLFAMSYESRH